MRLKMTDDTTVVHGPWFEDFQRGQHFDAPAVTLTSGHAATYQALFGDRLRPPLDHALWRRMGGGSNGLAHPLLAVHVAIGQSTWASQRVKANLYYRGLQLLRPVELGDTLHTVTTVVGLRQNRPQAGRAATGIVALEMRSTNQRDEPVLHFQRCPMIPCRDPDANTGHADDLDAIGRGTDMEQVPQALGAAFGAGFAAVEWSGTRGADLRPGERLLIEARDTVTLAPELVRLTLNMAMAHTDAGESYLGARLVYGGHVISTAFAQATRALPGLLTIVAWESCDHTAPVQEGDLLRTEVTVTATRPAPCGALLGLRLQTWAQRPSSGPEESRVLDWRFSALSR